MSTSTDYAMSRSQEILLVSKRELRNQLFKKSTVISTVFMLIVIVAGVILSARLSGDDAGSYRLGVVGSEQEVAALTPSLEQLAGGNGEPITVVDLASTEPETALSEDVPEASRVDMVLDLSAEPRILVRESADEAVSAGVTGVMQQAALSSQIAGLGGDPTAVASTLLSAAPEVVVLDPPTEEQEGFGSRYLVFMIINMVMYLVMLGGGQMIAMGVVEEKSSRIVEILLACVRPTSLLAGKVLGIGTAVIATTAVLGIAGTLTAKLTDAMPDADFSLDSALVAMLVWMVVGYATFSVAFGAAGAMVSRQEDVGNVVMPLIMLCAGPFILSMVMVMGDPEAMVWRILSYVPPFSAFLMPARLVFGVSSWLEQAIGLVIALAFLPLLVRAAAGIYTRAVTRTGSRVRLKEALGRTAA